MNKMFAQQFLALSDTESRTFQFRDTLSKINTEETYVSGKTLPREREAALAALAILRKADDDFDGHGTLAPDCETLDTAQRLIQTCFGRMYPTNIYPGVDRSLVLAYAASDLDHVLHVTVDRDMLFVSKIMAEGRIQKVGKYTMPMEFVALPNEIRAVLPAYQR